MSTAITNGEILDPSHTILSNCCRSSKISEKSGLKDGSCCQHLSSSSANLGCEWLGIDGLRPWNPCQDSSSLLVVSKSLSQFELKICFYDSRSHYHQAAWSQRMMIKRIYQVLIFLFPGLLIELKFWPPPPPVLILMQGIKKYDWSTGLFDNLWDFLKWVHEIYTNQKVI